MSRHLVRSRGCNGRWHPSGLVRLLLVGLGGLACIGCQTPQWSWENPFQRRTSTALTSDTSLAARIAGVQEESKGIRYLSEAEQMQVSTRLAQTFSKEPHPAVRREIAKSLGSFHTPAALEGLQLGLRDADREVRIAACESLALWDTPESWRLLEEALHSDTDVDVRLAATRCLGRSQDASRGSRWPVPWTMRIQPCSTWQSNPCSNRPGVRSAMT